MSLVALQLVQIPVSPDFAWVMLAELLLETGVLYGLIVLDVWRRLRRRGAR